MVSKLDINSKSPLYNEGWVKPNFDFYSTTGFGLSLGFTRKLTENCQAHLSVRWQKWGGLNDDHLFNTQRIVIIDTKFWREKIPLHSTIFSTFIGIKL